MARVGGGWAPKWAVLYTPAAMKLSDRPDFEARECLGGFRGGCVTAVIVALGAGPCQVPVDFGPV